ncbi:MAG: DUF4252 domain-containing protein [Bacteroidota bacterium]
MKYLWIMALALLAAQSPATAQTDAISQYFEKYMDDESFTTVYLSPKMFELLGKLDLEQLEDREAAEVMKVVSDLKGLRVLTTEKDTEARYEEAMSLLDVKDYEILMTVRDEGENVHFWVKDDGGNIINELLLLVGGADDFVLLSFVGNIDLKKISKLASSVDIDGLEHLEKLDEEEIEN